MDFLQQIENLTSAKKKLDQTVKELEMKNGRLLDDVEKTQQELDIACCKKLILEAENKALKDDREELKAEIWTLKKANSSLMSDNMAMKIDDAKEPPETMKSER